MPVTRRRRANPPEEPENNNHLAVQAENPSEVPASEQAVAQPIESSSAAETTEAPVEAENAISPRVESTPYQVNLPLPPAAANGERVERQEYTPSVAPVEAPPPLPAMPPRRTSFRRPVQSQMPPVAIAPPPIAPVLPSLPSPTHEISLPLGNLLHLAYNPSYTGSDEARSTLLHKLAHESKTGGRARCWSCGSLAIAYDYWNTRNKNFGEVGVAFCEICGVWSVM